MGPLHLDYLFIDTHCIAILFNIPSIPFSEISGLNVILSSESLCRADMVCVLQVVIIQSIIGNI